MSLLRSARITSLIALGACAAACGGGSSPSATPSSPGVTPSQSPSVVAVAPGPVVPSTPSLSAAQVADPGLPSKIGSGRLTASQVRQLMQYFEDKVSAAYAAGDPDGLDHYLAGSMLSGNRTTIDLLNSQHELNVYRVTVAKVTIGTSSADHVEFEMTGDMTVDHFVDSQTDKVINGGRPGPSRVHVSVVLDENLKSHTWYWTGEKSE